MKKYIFLTFDVEEFDMPLEYQQNISPNEQMQVGLNGLKAIQPLLDLSFMKCTLFTTANFAIHFPYDIKELSKKHEIASHTYFHTAYETKHLAASKLELEKICNCSVEGLRMPRLRKVDVNDVLNAGYTYDSSINPTYLPGRYNNRHLPKTIYHDNNLLRVPTAVTPNFRLPLFWLAFKNVPYSLYKFWCLQVLRKYGYLSLYFHPWEFVELEKYQIPNYTKKPCGQNLLKKLERLINDLKDEAEFITIKDYLKIRQNKT